MAVKITDTVIIDDTRILTNVAAIQPFGSGNGSAGQILSSTGTGISWVTMTSAYPKVNVQSFTASGTWYMPANTDCVIVRCWGAGGGGAGGQLNSNDATSAAYWGRGGQGGSGGSYAEKILNANDLPSSVFVVVGTGGLGGNKANSGARGWGFAGSDGGDSWFGPSASDYTTAYVVAGGGLGGQAGTGTISMGGDLKQLSGGDSFLANTIQLYSGNTGVSTLSGSQASQPSIYGGAVSPILDQNNTNNGNKTANGGCSLFGGGAGGAGGNINAPGTSFYNGGDGGSVIGIFQTGVDGGGAKGGNTGSSGAVVQAGANGVNIGDGGGGGGSVLSSTAQFINPPHGGSGGIAGGGGGGGGAKPVTGVTGEPRPGNGGTGGNGYVQVISWAR